MKSKLIIGSNPSKYSRNLTNNVTGVVMSLHSGSAHKKNSDAVRKIVHAFPRSMRG